MKRHMIAALVFGVPLLAVAGAAPAFAHHSYVMFDQTKLSKIEGTVAKVDWGDPHVYFWVYVSDGKGGHDVYALESSSVNALARRGWKKDTLRVGEKVTIAYHPLKDGRLGGSFLTATHAEGTVSDATPPGQGPRASVP